MTALCWHGIDVEDCHACPLDGPDDYDANVETLNDDDDETERRRALMGRAS